MKRWILAAVISIASATAVQADVWMVKSSGHLGCRERAQAMALASQSASPPASLPDGCVALYAGERLIDRPEVGVGFDAFARVLRSNKSTLYVSRSALVLDPGIGTVTEDRPD